MRLVRGPPDMGALDAFMSTWSNARSTLGEGTPQDGAQFDRSTQLRQAQSGVESAAPASRWIGTAADSYAEANSRQGRVLGQMAVLDQRLGAEVDRSAAVVAAGRQNLDQVRQWVLDAASTVPPGADREQALMPIARKGIGDVADVVRQTNSDLNAIGARIQTIGNEYKQFGGPKENGPGAEDPDGKDRKRKPQIPDSKDPNEVKRWWDSLSKSQQDQLPRDHPDKLGNLNGVPVMARSTANKTVMQADLDRVTNAAAQHNVSVDEVQAHPQDYGLTPTDITRYTNATKVKEGLEHNSEKTHGAPTFLQVYEPDAFNGQGRAAIAIGDPDHAANTAVVVPGTGHSVTEGWLGSDDAANVYYETRRADPGRNTSVVAWMGYDAPDSMTDIRVAQTGLAHQGGALLASDINGLNATHDGASHVTVIGHSYGSTTVADAAAGFGMRTDDVVLIGCPGTDMASRASDFHLPPGGHVYVGGASTDPVTYLGNMPGGVGLGADPYLDSFGSTRFKAEAAGTWAWQDHSHYYDKGSESLFSIGDIASGHGDALENDHMTARHRIEGGHIPGTPITIPFVPTPSGVPVIPPDIDPELGRPGRTGHTH